VNNIPAALGRQAHLAVRDNVTIHLRELPSVALEALMNLITSSGPQALVFAITEEIASRHPQRHASTLNRRNLKPCSPPPG
jgi:arginine/lysine/ornithine decarboxylase